MKKNKSWLSLVIAIGITLVMSLLALYILEYMIPFWKNTKNIEHSVSAYYQADSGIEDALLNDTANILDTTLVDYWIELNKVWLTLPPALNWNSEFDKDFNIIRIWEPIQIEIGWYEKKYDTMGFKFSFKIPDIDSSNSATLSWTVSNKIINWQLSAKDNILNASGSQIDVTQINNIIDLDIFQKNSNNNEDWLELDDSLNDFETFYNLNCFSTWSGCILKMSVINKIEWYINLNDTNFPYLEWKIETSNPIPLRYKIIDTTWQSYGFQKSLRVKIPQQTLNEAFDFTVFQ